MPNYATALDLKPQKHPTFDGSDYVPGMVAPGDVHAVVWPDPEGRDWDDTETVCGRPTQGMEQQDHSDPTHWPIPKWRRMECRVCDDRTE